MSILRTLESILLLGIASTWQLTPFPSLICRAIMARAQMGSREDLTSTDHKLVELLSSIPENLVTSTYALQMASICRDEGWGEAQVLRVRTDLPSICILSVKLIILCSVCYRS